MSDQQFDYVVVGGGAAGGVLAARLTEDPNTTVLLLEAGPDYGADRSAWPTEIRDPQYLWEESHPWGYLNAPGPTGFQVNLPRGKVLGGSSTINGCVWLRGSELDYDGWEAAGNADWGFDDLLPAFKRAEDDPMAASNDLHGDDGPIPVWRTPDDQLTPLERQLYETAEELNFDRLPDLNGYREQRPGIGMVPKNVATNGEPTRVNVAFAYLETARGRDNLTIIADTLIDRVLFEGKRATGVRTAEGYEFKGREVILTSGAYGSPAILLRSGVGPAVQLQSLGIPIVAELSGVGEHLMDHPSAKGVNRFYLMRDEDAPGDKETIIFARPLIFARSNQVERDIDLHIYPIQIYSEDLGEWVFRLTPGLQYSRSTGHVRLTSTDPEATLDIDHRYFSDPADLEALCDGVILADQITEAPPLRDRLTSTKHKYQWEDRDQLRTFVQQRVATSYHPSCTCRMGPANDRTAVVDDQCRVHGLEGLRVIDASIFPHIPRCNLHYPTIAVAEHMAARLRQEG